MQYTGNNSKVILLLKWMQTNEIFRDLVDELRSGGYWYTVNYNHTGRECPLTASKPWLPIFWRYNDSVPCITTTIWRCRILFVRQWQSNVQWKLSWQWLKWHRHVTVELQGLYSTNGRASYRTISWSLEETRFGFVTTASLWNLTDISAAILPKCLSNFRSIEKV